MERIYRLERWYREEAGSARSSRLTGQIHDRPGFPEGTWLTTSYLIARYHRMIATATGSCYYLGIPHENTIPPGADPLEFRETLVDECGLIVCRDANHFRSVLDCALSMKGNILEREVFPVTNRQRPRVQG